MLKWVSEALSWLFYPHVVAMAIKPHLALKRMRVHQNNKRTPQENAWVVYQVPCKDYPCVYTGETVRRYSAKEKEHQRYVRSLEEVKFTSARKKDSVYKVHPSVITDHATKNNHTIDWQGVKFLSRDCDTTKRGVWEAIAIKRTGSPTMNCDGGHHQHSPCYTKQPSCDARGQHWWWFLIVRNWD